jgi:hypothetical protein
LHSATVQAAGHRTPAYIQAAHRLLKEFFMNRPLKLAVLSLAAAASALTPLAEANAGQRHRQHEVRRSSDSRDLVVAGILGLAVGDIAAGVIASSEEDEPVNPYRHPRPQIDREYLFGNLAEPEVTEEPEVVYYNEYEPNFEPWSRDWQRWCSREYRSFDPDTGTYIGYDGIERFCIAD